MPLNASLWGAITIEILIALCVLLVLFTFFAGILIWAQLSPNSTFDVGNFLRDDQGKESSGRAFGFVALAIHSWWVVTLVLQERATLDHFLYYGIIWAGTPAIMILAHRWGGNLPLSQPGFPPSVATPAPPPYVPERSHLPGPDEHRQPG